ncbi:MAG: cadherin-like domain-containing protein, partial [Crocinitomicaceae bacterium]|nr:cadherin-like domain-containing protein [Crocinitomicaceae bacterium]
MSAIITLMLSALSFAATPVLGSDGVLSYYGETDMTDSVHLGYNGSQTQILLDITYGGITQSYAYNVEDVGQFRFISVEHDMMAGSMDQLVNQTNLSTEIIHHDPIPNRIWEMVAMFDLVKYVDVTHTTVQSGDWFDPATWGGPENIPMTGDRVLIRSQDTITVSGIMPNTYRTIRVDGMLKFSTNSNSSLKVSTLVVNMMGHFEMGSSSAPIQEGVNATLIIDKLAEFEVNDVNSPDYDPLKLGLGLISHGSISIHGAEKTGHATFNGAPVGVNSVLLDHLPTDWKIGDQVVIAGTQTDGQGDEVRTIASISGNTLAFNTALSIDHLTPTHTKAGLTLKVHVINTTRNAIIETAHGNRTTIVNEEFKGRGHVMFMHSNDVNIQYGGFYFLGRTNKQGVMHNAEIDSVGNILSTAQNPIARYPVHFHRAGNEGSMGVVNGCAVFNSPGWGYVNHRSAVHITNNVAYDVHGASFVSEAGDEIGSFIDNISIRTIGNGRGNITATGANGATNITRFGSAGDGFWFHSQLLDVRNNVASGFTGSGFHVWNQLIDHIVDSVALQQKMIFQDNTSYGGHTGFQLSFQSPASDYHQVNNQIIYAATHGLRKKYSHKTVFNNLVAIGDLGHPFGSAIDANNNGRSFTFVNPHLEGFVRGMDFEHRPDKAGVIGGYLNNVYNLLVNVRHDRVQNIFFGGGIQFDTLSSVALNVLTLDTNQLALDSLHTFDGNQYDYFGIREIEVLIDSAIIVTNPNRMNGDSSNFIIEENGTLYRAYLETEQAADFKPWTGTYAPNTWDNLTNEELFYLGGFDGIYSKEYYASSNVVYPGNRHGNVVFEEVDSMLFHLPMYLLNELADITIPVGTTTQLDLSDVFIDPHGLGVTHLVDSNSNSIIATAFITNDNLGLTGLSVGLTTVVIQGTNMNGNYPLFDTILVTVTDSNVLPYTVNDQLTTNWNTQGIVDVLANDSDSDQGSYGLTVAAITQGANGTTLLNTDGTITYAPNANFSGNDSFTYMVEDILGGQST